MARLRNYHSKKEIADIQALGPAEAMRRLKGGVEHSPEEITRFQQLIEKRPDYARQVRATVAYAREQGGLTLEFWRRFNGPAFGEPWIMTLAACAEELQVPVETLERIMADTFAAVSKRLSSES